MAANFPNWHRTLDKIIKQQGKNGGLHTFSTLTQNVDRILFCEEVASSNYSDDVRKYFQACKKTKNARKNNILAKEEREKGNDYFKRKKDLLALEAYTKCVLNAPSDDTSDKPQLAMGLANRSAVLYHRQQYQECLDDIELALCKGYPVSLHYKIYQRKAQCLFNLKKYHQAHTDFLKTKDLVINSTESDKRKESILKDVNDWILKVTACIDSGDGNTSDNNSAVQTIPKISYGRSDTIPQASKAMALKYDDLRGRHLIASEELKAGDTLIVERPFAAVLLPSHYDTSCHHCFAQLPLTIYPCRDCVEVKYCSVRCQEESWTQYHNIECPYLPLLHSVGIAHLSLRVILAAGLNYLIEFYDQTLEDLNGKIGGLSSGGGYEAGYLSVYHLMPHTKHMVPADLLQYSLTAILLLECLEEGGFFHNIPDSFKSSGGYEANIAAKSVEKLTSMLDNLAAGEDNVVNMVEKGDQLVLADNEGKNGSQNGLHCVKDVKTYIGGLILHHICQLVCNAHAITEVEVSPTVNNSMVETASQERVATAIYPTTSLLNHSCDPTIISSFHKDTLVVRAVKNVKKGEEIFNCYGPHCKRMSLQDRQQTLKEQYFFTCQCPSCLRDLIHEDKFKALCCPKCKGAMAGPRVESTSTDFTCFDCHHKMDGKNEKKTVLQSHDIFLKGVELLNQGDIRGAIPHLEKCLEKRQRVMYKHNKDLAEVQDALAKAYAQKGDFKKSSDCLELSVATIGFIYGEDSIEYANELHKYAEVLLKVKCIPQALEGAIKARRILSVHYGEGHKSVSDINELVQCLQMMAACH